MTEFKAHSSSPTRQISADARADSWTLSLSLALTLTLMRSRLLGLFDGATELRHFFDRAIGMTTVAGVDASGYAHGYVKLQLMLAIVFFLSFAGFHALRSRLDHHGDPAAPEHRWIARLAELWAALGAYDVFFPSIDLRPQSHLLAFLATLTFGVLVARSVPRFPAASLFAPLRDADRHFLVATVLWPVPLLFAGSTLFSDRVSLGTLPEPIWYALWATVWIGILLVVRRSDEARRLRLLWAGLPWLLVPAALPTANEIQVRFRSLNPQVVALLLITLLVAASLALALGLPGRARRAQIPEAPEDQDVTEAPSSRRWTSRRLLQLYFPLVVVVAGLLRFHAHRIHLGILDYFHLGEGTLPAHQFFRFGTRPILDLRLSHTFSDMLWPWLYGLFHGVRDLDFLVWNEACRNLVALILAYFVLARLVSPSFALLAALFLPVATIFSRQYALALLPALFVAAAVRRPTTGRFVALGASLAALFLWRIDFGMVGTVAAVGVIGLQLMRGAHRRWAAARAGLWLAGGGGVALLALRALGGSGTFDTLAFFFQSYSYRLLTRVRPEVMESFGAATVLQYYLLPALAMVYVLYLAIQRLVLRRYVPPRKVMLIFVAIFCLVISTRSMERHSLIESFNPYLAAPLLALLPFFFQSTGRRVERPATRAAFVALLVVMSVFALPPAKKNLSGPASIVLRHDATLFQLQRFTGDVRRVKYFDERHRPFTLFVDEVLEPGETFFEFANAPLLYVLTDRQIPTYVIPTLLHTSETVQARVVEELTRRLEANTMPMVVLKQGNRFWDATDEVPNEIRSYRVAEWIYRNYRPAVKVGKYEIWWQRDRDVPWTLEPRTELWPLATQDSERLYGLTVEILEPTAGIRLVADAADAHGFDLFDTSGLPPLREYSNWRLELGLDSDSEEPVQVFFGFDGKYFEAESHAWIFPDEAADGVVELDIPLQKGAERLTDLRFDPTQGSELVLKSLRLKADATVHRPLSEEHLAQRFPMGLLPHVWARYDPFRAVEATRELAALTKSPLELQAGESRDLAVPAALSAVDSAGRPDPVAYLHLRIRPLAGDAGQAVGEGDLRLSYGDPESSFTFDLPPGEEPSDHLIRLTTQWRWWRGGVETLEIKARRPVVVESALLRSSD